MGIKTKISLAMLGLIFLTASVIVTFSYYKSNQELKSAVEAGNLNLASTVSEKIRIINESEFKLICVKSGSWQIQP